jgi:hypothetical protein
VDVVVGTGIVDLGRERQRHAGKVAGAVVHLGGAEVHAEVVIVKVTIGPVLVADVPVHFLFFFLFIAGPGGLAVAQGGVGSDVKRGAVGDSGERDLVRGRVSHLVGQGVIGLVGEFTRYRVTVLLGDAGEAGSDGDMRLQQVQAADVDQIFHVQGGAGVPDAHAADVIMLPGDELYRHRAAVRLLAGIGEVGRPVLPREVLGQRCGRQCQHRQEH